jgi:hypothetical protein
MKMATKFAIVKLGYNAAYSMPIEKLSTFLTLLNSATKVDDSYIPGEGYVFHETEANVPEVKLLEKAPLTQAQWDKAHAEGVAKREAEEAAERAAKASAESEAQSLED